MKRCPTCKQPNGRKNNQHGYCKPCNRKYGHMSSKSNIKEMADSYRPKEAK